MILLVGLVTAAFLVGLGYLNLWAAARQGTPRGLATFGRILGIVLFVIAGFSLLVPAAAVPLGIAGRFGRKHFSCQPGHRGKGRGFGKGFRVRFGRGRGCGREEMSEHEGFEEEDWDDFEDEEQEELLDNLEERIELLEAKVYGE